MALPVFAFALALGTLTGAAAVFGYDPFTSSTWIRYDSRNYLDIAKDGYELFPCPDEPSSWCGDSGWFPAYPWAIRALSYLGLPIRGTAVALSWVLAAATIVLLWATFFRRRTGPAVLAALVYAAFAPGQVYHYAVFPLSLLAFSTITCLWLLYRGRWVAAGVAGAVAALSYPIGIVLVPVSAVWILSTGDTPVSERIRRVALATGGILVGLGLLVVVQWAATGRWDAYFLVQEGYDHGLQDPFTATWTAVQPVLDGVARPRLWAIATQTALLTTVLLLVFAHALRHWWSLDRLHALVLLWAVAAWSLPLTSTAVSVQRTQAALVPLAILVARLPRSQIYVLAVASASVAILMAKMFFDGSVV